MSLILRGLIAGLLILILLIVVKTWGSAEVDENLLDETDYPVLYFTTLVRGNDSAIADTAETVIRTETDWSSIIDSLDYFEPPRPVDFQQAMLFLVALPVDTGGYQLEIESVEHAPDSVIVSYVIFEPGGDCLNVEASVTPYHVVEVRREDEPVAFRPRREYVFCDTQR